MAQPIDDIWIQLGCKQMDLYEKDSEAYRKCLVYGSSIRSILKSVYVSIIKFKLADPIEELPSDEKEILWKEALDLGRDSLNQEGLIDLVKSLYVIKCFLTK